MQSIAAAAFIALFVFSVPFPFVICTAGLIGFIAARQGFSSASKITGHEPSSGNAPDKTYLLSDTLRADPQLHAQALRAAALSAILWLAPLAALIVSLGEAHIFSQIAIFFSKMALVTFGGAYAVLTYVAQQAVEQYGWLKPGEMLDGLGMAETTPGPLVMVLQFVGFMGAFRAGGDMSPLLAGTIGGLIATWVTFAPCFLWIFLGAPFIDRLRGNMLLSGALSAITAAVVGVILNLAVWFAVHTLFGRAYTLEVFGARMELPDLASANLPAIALALGAAIALFRFKAGMLQVLAACSLAGLALHVGGVI
jgi:chromate transporter